MGITRSNDVLFIILLNKVFILQQGVVTITLKAEILLKKNLQLNIGIRASSFKLNKKKHAIIRASGSIENSTPLMYICRPGSHVHGSSNFCTQLLLLSKFEILGENVLPLH